MCDLLLKMLFPIRPQGRRRGPGCERGRCVRSGPGPDAESLQSPEAAAAAPERQGARGPLPPPGPPNPSRSPDLGQHRYDQHTFRKINIRGHFKVLNFNSK